MASRSDIKKPRQRELISARRSTRLQSQVFHNSEPQLVHASFTLPVDVSGPQHIKRKRLHDSEADESDNVHLAKHPRTSLPPPAELSEKNLQVFDRENMEFTPNITPRRRKQSSSRHSMTSTEVSQDTSSGQSRSSCSSAAHYRYRHLQNAQIYIHGPPPPAEIQASIDLIVKAEVPKERQTELLAISQGFHEGCTRVVKAAVGEDDCVGVLRIALLAMDRSKAVFREKTAWREELLPRILPFDFDLSFVHGYQKQEVDDTSARPRKRQQQTGLAYISPEPSRTGTSLDTPGTKAIDSDIMPPPECHSSFAKDESKDAKSKNSQCNSHIRKPVPDMTIGIELEALVSALSSQNINAVNAVRFLDLLQTSRVRRQPDGPDEPMLSVVPMQRDSDLVFPFAVVEAKSYSTGKPIFEAQNQAGVSGACGLKILLCLDEMVNNARTSSHVPLAPSNALLFSICTEGPIHELWVHYTTIADGVRKFNMRLLKTCNGMLLEGVVDFLFAVDNVLGWGVGGFLDWVVDQLGEVARRGKKRACLLVERGQ